MATRNLSIETCLLALLSSTGKSNIRSMTQLRHFPLLHRDLTEAVRLYIRAALSHSACRAALQKAGMTADHAEMQVFRRLLFHSLAPREAAPVCAMDRILAKAVSAGAQDAMDMLQRSARTLCNDACRQFRRAV